MMISGLTTKRLWIGGILIGGYLATAIALFFMISERISGLGDRDLATIVWSGARLQTEYFRLRQAVETGGGADHVHDGIDGTHLVEMDALGRDPVHAPLRLGERREDRESAIAHGRPQPCRRQQPADLPPAAPVVRGIVRILPPPTRAAGYDDAQVTRRQRAAPDARDHQTMRDAEAREIDGQLAPREAGIEQRRQEHVAGDPGEGIEMEQPGTARYALPARHARLIRVASAAAPNPLSMFTTPTFGAQLLSIASRAATPPNDAP